jgi:hypothetical protein
MGFMNASCALVVQQHAQAIGGMLINILDQLYYYKLTGMIESQSVINKNLKFIYFSKMDY